jgi:hypothetical protein
MKTAIVKKISAIKETREKKGLELSIVVKVYDNGFVYVNGQPMMNRKADTALLSASSVIAQLLIELKEQAEKRKR